MKRQRNTTQMKEQTRNREVQIKEVEISKLPEKEFKIMIVKMIKYLENKMKKMQESINKNLEELKNKHTETNNTITEIKSRRNWTSLVVQWLRICLPMQEAMGSIPGPGRFHMPWATRLMYPDTEPMCHNY